MTGIDPSYPPNNNQSPEPAAEPVNAEAAQAAQESAASARRSILIGSQRDPAAYQRRRRRRDWAPVDDAGETASKKPAGETASEMPAVETAIQKPVNEIADPTPAPQDHLASDLDADLQMALSDASLGALMSGGDLAMDGEDGLEPESRHAARVVAVRRNDVFVELCGRQQGCVPLAQFDQPPKPGDALEVVVQKLNADDGLYDLRIPAAAAQVAEWSDLVEGMSVEAQVTGHNSGGLECEVNHIRGFIPISQVALYRVEDVAEFVGQRLTCIVTEANPMRRNLVLSRRAVLEREKEEARQKLLDTLEPGQVYEGVVRKIMDFGAFVDIGGVDGLLHVSQLAWSRVNHPSEVLQQGQSIKVKIEKFDRETGKISFSYRDLLENPWTNAPAKFPPNSVVRGKVTKLMEFGAFVELEPGVEGLVHISELSHKRVWCASDVVHEGNEVEVFVLAVDAEAQRISLSMKALSRPEPTKPEKEAAQAEQAAAPASTKRRRPDHTLQGGLGKASGGDRFGLKW